MDNILYVQPDLEAVKL